MENQKPVSLFDQEEKRKPIIFEPSYYVAHLGILLYILTGICIQAYHYLADGTYRLLSIATWPWVLTSSSWLLLVSVIAYFYAWLTIARNIKKRLDDVEISWFSVLPMGFYFLVWIAMLGRLLAYYISPEGIYFEGAL
ncbi:MAG: hypothetical protein MH137_04530 [Flavobacteriales bacterium]|nr:hypothetical protein [Flavobacteriales bacterium]